MSNRAKTFPAWPFFSVATVLIVVVILLLLRQYRLTACFQVITYTTGLSPGKTSSQTPLGAIDQLPLKKARQQLTYEQLIAILRQEANIAAVNRPQHLTVLAGDSLSMWFPTDLLPLERNWLNQGISGDTSAGLLRRLKLFDRTQPKTIFVMIGINDFIRGVSDETILENQQQIIRYLLRVHPDSQIVMQSILPHNWEGSVHKRSHKENHPLGNSNSRIRRLNRQTKVIAAKEGVNYLDLHPLFTDAQGNLRPELSTDGLHLNRDGYLVWRSALQMYTQVKLEPHTGN